MKIDSDYFFDRMTDFGVFSRTAGCVHGIDFDATRLGPQFSSLGDYGTDLDCDFSVGAGL